MITLNLNGQDHELDVAADMPLLWALRDVANLTGTKYGCGMALCGACTVNVEGQPTRSCVTPVSAVVGKRITPWGATSITAWARARGLNNAASSIRLRIACLLRACTLGQSSSLVISRSDWN